MSGAFIDRRDCFRLGGAAGLVCLARPGFANRPASPQLWALIEARANAGDAYWKRTLPALGGTKVDALVVSPGPLLEEAFIALLTRLADLGAEVGLPVHAELGPMEMSARKPHLEAVGATPHYRFAAPELDIFQRRVRALLTVPTLSGVQLRSAMVGDIAAVRRVNDYLVAPMHLDGKAVTIVEDEPGARHAFASDLRIDGVFRKIGSSGEGVGLLRQQMTSS